VIIRLITQSLNHLIGVVSRKAFIIGLDGATFRVLDPLIAAGRLPTFASIIKQGVRGVLHSTAPPNSPVGWSSLMTGKNPGKHGVFGFFSIVPGQYELALSSGSHIRSQTLWELVSVSGQRVAVVNMPYTYPPRPVSGVIVSGMDTPDLSQATYPKEFAAELLAAVPGYSIELNMNRSGHLERKQWLKRHLRERVETHAKAMRYILKAVNPELFAGVFTVTDRAHHFLWDDIDERHPQYDPQRAAQYGPVIAELYELLDGIVRGFVAQMDEASTLFIVSDHGFCGIHKTFFVNHWLYQHGWLSMVERPEADYGVVALRFLKRHPTLYHLARSVKNHLPLASLREKKINRRSLGLRAQLRNIDWSRTRAYYVNGQGLRLNVKGREPMGIVDPAEYDQVVETLVASLSQIREPESDAPVFARVARREGVYSGDQTERAVDIILLENTGDDDPRKNFTTSGKIEPTARDQLFRVKNIPGHHDGLGILLAIGNGIKRGVNLRNARLIDIAPTVLYNLGLPIPNDIDGRVLTEMFTEDFLAAHPPQYRVESGGAAVKPPAYTEAEQAAIEERLEELGYLG
jgi:predicted AlkP superfamily phosphohydrolase/phosphomutase